MAEGMGLQAATATLSKVAIGAGLLTVPFAFREAGVGGAIAILVGCVVLQACSLYALTLAIRRGGGDARAAAENRGYAGLVTALIGTDVGAYVDVVQSLCNFGALVSFLQICATELGDFMMELSPVFRRAGFEECRIGGIWVVTLLVVFPLASMPTMSSLRFSSAFGLICISFVLFVVVVSFFVVDIDDGRGRICGNLNLNDNNDNNEHMVPNVPEASNELPLMWTDSFISITKAATIIAFGFINQVQYVPILLELRNPSWARTWVLILGSTTVCFFADILIGSFGYLTFCSNTKNCILDNYDSSLGDVYLAARMTFMVSLLITCPLVIFPVRESICATYLSIRGRRRTESSSQGRWKDVNGVDPCGLAATDTRLEVGGGRPGTLTKGTSSNESSPLIVSRVAGEAESSPVPNVDGEDHASLRLVVTMAIVIAGLIIASIVQQLDLVVGIVGAFGGGLLMFTIPAAVAFVTIVQDARSVGAPMTGSSIFRVLADAPVLGRLHAGSMLVMGVFGIVLSITGTALQFADR